MITFYLHKHYSVNLTVNANIKQKYLQVIEAHKNWVTCHVRSEDHLKLCQKISGLGLVLVKNMSMIKEE